MLDPRVKFALTQSSMTTIDKDALKAKYAAERYKRLRPDGNAQYLQLKDQLAHYLDDPYTPVVEREPKTDHVTVAFIGGGFAGLLTGARLKEAGVDDVRIIEKGGDFGGTWYWNRYPGAQCDTASFVYMPLLEETGHMPSEKYAHAPEILEHSQRIGKQFGLYDNALFHTQVTDLEWDDDRSCWIVRTNRGDEFTAQFVAMGTGPLHVPKLPGIPGHRGLPRPLVPHQPLGLRLHGRRPLRRPDGGAGRQAGGRHRHRGHGGAVHPSPRPGLQGALRVPTHAVVGRRARQPTDRSRVVRHRQHPGLAAALARELHRQPDDGGDARGGPGPGRLDRPRPPDP